MKENLRVFGNFLMVADINRCEGCSDKNTNCPINKFVEMVRSDKFYGEISPLAHEAGLGLKSAFVAIDKVIATTTGANNLPMSLSTGTIHSVRTCPEGNGTIEIYTEAG